ncbi:MAG: hypothetical protein A2286_02690 [Gammaproteobacteria bacterium RIFOXYA12_FULL_61_12]|nr:MAG: hypothetical protein A2286_02690 [Gammaproteobacteria bacterium RIFOXYA12_FULL_61_12]OGT89747.1 MAG: hypothetical protein A2514_10345 [Gammaproteobacteria bacterium RIFOXYD12_FULL_61_37]
MLTAAEARELSGPLAEEYLAVIEAKIREAAEKKEREVIFRDKPYCDWLYSPVDMTPEAKKTVEALREAGYLVDLYYRETQFVDMALRVKW